MTTHLKHSKLTVQLTFSLLIISILSLAGCSPEQTLLKFDGTAQGTTYHISFWTSKNIDAQKLEQDVADELQRIDKLMSNYRPDSTIELFNTNPSIEVQEVDPEIVELIGQARTVYLVSSACYDLTVKPLVDLWGFHGDYLTPPDADTLDQIMPAIGMDKLETVDREHLRKSEPLLQVDLGSIGQGYTVARMVFILEQHGIQNYIAEIGGELQTRGHRPDGQAWRVAVEQPLADQRTPGKIITINTTGPVAVITSGTYRHFFDQDGIRYSHIIDPRNGRPIEHNTVSVTVVDADPTKASAWATALLCLGQNAGLKVAEEQNIAALFIDQNGEGFTEYSSKALTEMEGIQISK